MFADPLLERAWLAQRAMVPMLPILSGFASAICQRPIQVVMDKGNPRTDGQRIYLRPPMELADIEPHVKRDCLQRDPDTSVQLCPACRRMERVWSTCFHEIAHCAFDTFAAVSDKDKADLIKQVIAEQPKTPQSRLDKIQQDIENLTDKGYMGVCSVISPYLPRIFNSLEDARVNRAMYTARAGCYHMFRAKAIDVFENGIHFADGFHQKWNEVKPNAQLIVGLYAKASGFDYQDWFKPEIVACLNDPDLTALLDGTDQLASPADVYRLGPQVLEIVRRHGFCKRRADREDDAPPPPEPQPQDEQPEPESGVPEEDDPEQQQQGETDDESDQEQATEDDDASKSDSDGEESEDGDAPDDDDEEEASDEADSEGSGEDASSSESDDADEDEAEADSDESGTGDDPDGDEEDSSDALDGDGDDDDATDAGYEGEDSDDLTDDEGDESFPSGDDDEDGGSAGVPEDDDDEDDIDEALKLMGDHMDPTGEEEKTQEEEDEALDQAIKQADFFDAPSENVVDVNVIDPLDPTNERVERLRPLSAEADPTTLPPESLLAGTLLRTRKVFIENKKARREYGFRAGRVASHRLATVPTGNREVFSRATNPGKRDYFVSVTMDCSGSTASTPSGMEDSNITVTKRLGAAIGELLQRVNVPFAMHAHTACSAGSRITRRAGMALDLIRIKGEHDPWDDRARDIVSRLTACSGNLDGHTLEWQRKLVERSQATEKIILYVTDGAMPAMNYQEELVILQREIETCRRLGIQLIGVGVRTDSPTAHGLDTVQLDSTEDLPLLVQEIERRLAR